MMSDSKSRCLPRVRALSKVKQGPTVGEGMGRIDGAPERGEANLHRWQNETDREIRDQGARRGSPALCEVRSSISPDSRGMLITRGQQSPQGT